MALETGTYISDLVATNPTASDPKAQGDDHIRLLKSTVKVTFPNVSGAVTPTHVELNYVDGVTSAIQTQLDGKLPLTGGTISSNLAVTGTLGVTGAFSGTTGAFSGAVTGVTATAGDSSTKFATTAYVQSTAFSSALPSQTGNSGKFVTTDGTNASWSYVSLTASVSGVLPVANGGTGAATLTGLVKGNGTSAMTAAVAGTDYQAVLVSATNIKTINGITLLGSGDITVGGQSPLTTVTATAAAAALVNSGLTSTYDVYDLVITGTTSDQASVFARFEVAGSVITTNTYEYSITKNGSATTVAGGSTATSIQLINDTGGSSSCSFSVTIRITKPAATGQTKRIEWLGSSNTSGGGIKSNNGAGMNQGTGAVTGIQIYPNSGTITCVMRLYPVLNA